MAGTSVAAQPANGSGRVPTAATSGAPATFQLGDSGTVTLSAAGGALSIASVTPNPGWTVERAWQDGPAAVEVRMGSAAGEVRFEAALVRNVVVHSLEIDPDSSGSGSGVSGSGDDSGSGSGDDSDSSGSGSSGSGSDDDSSGSGSSGSGSDD